MSCAICGENHEPIYKKITVGLIEYQIMDCPNRPRTDRQIAAVAVSASIEQQVRDGFARDADGD